MIIKQFATAAAISLLATASWAKGITCTPAVLQPGDKLVIKIAGPFTDFSVVTPKKIDGVRDFFLNETGVGLVNSAQFVKNRGTVIDVDTAMLDGKNKLFSAPGVYQFKASTNLETDDGTPQYNCKVKFSGAKTSAAAPVTAGPKLTQSALPPVAKPIAPAAPTQVAAPKTVDQQLEDAYAKECPQGLVGLLCREKFRLTMCSGKWADEPAPGQSACKNSQRN